jgi:DNA-binding NarL/FixJ family response regulator
MPTFRVFLVDDHEPFRRVVRLILQVRDDLQIVGEASDGLEAVQKAKELRPDLILLDIDLPTLNGIHVARRLRDLVPRAKVLFLSIESSSDVATEAFNVGGAGYVCKLHVGTELLPAIETVLRGKQFIGSGLDNKLSGSTPTPVPRRHDEVFVYSEGGGRRDIPKTAATPWRLKGKGYEFCNCDFGCCCNFGGFPSSRDGSCRAFLGMDIDDGFCGGVDLVRFRCAVIFDWPKAVHEGHGQCIFVVEPTATEKQIEVLHKIFTGKLGGMPWEVLGLTFDVKGLAKAEISIEGSGPKSVFKAEGVGEGWGDTFKNPVTSEDHLANIEYPDGFIWKKGQCGEGTFSAKFAGVEVGAQNSNWALYNFDWSNA